MSYLTPLSSLGINLNRELEKKEENSNENNDANVNKLPKWLLDFETFSLNEIQQSNKETTNDNPRPLTENSLSKCPLWFKELVQNRRVSDTNTNDLHFNERISHAKHWLKNQDIEIKSNIESSHPEILTSRANQRHCASKMSSHSHNQSDDYNQMDKRINRSLTSLQTTSNNERPAGKQFSANQMRDGTFSAASKINQSKLTLKDLLDNNDREEHDFNDFIIPELPTGKVLSFEIKANWGDDDYVGLNGIEVFHTKDDSLIEKIWSEPDLHSNVNAVNDGIFRTHDDSHIWLTQINKTYSNKIKMSFKSPISIVLIRIWNYNKSRIYSSRGVRLVQIKLDEEIIFEGEIAKASGALQGPPEVFGDTILFTTNEEILEQVAKRDVSFQELFSDSS